MFTKKNEKEKSEELRVKAVFTSQQVEAIKPTAKKQPDSKNEPKLLSQKESVYLAVSKVAQQAGIKLEEKPVIKRVLTKDQLDKVHELVCADLSAGTTRLKDTESNQKKLTDPSKLKKYVRGMVQNWFRRDDRLNGTDKFK
jgi:hypothetical protein